MLILSDKLLIDIQLMHTFMPNMIHKPWMVSSTYIRTSHFILLIKPKIVAYSDVFQLSWKLWLEKWPLRWESLAFSAISSKDSDQCSSNQGTNEFF